MIVYNQQLSHYISDLFAAEDEALRHIRLETPKQGLPDIAIEPEEGRFLQFLAATCRAKLALEIGTLGGYSSVWIARGMQPGGRLITIEKSARHAEVAQAHLAYSGAAEQVEIRVGDAHQILPGLAELKSFDFIFIDAEKSGNLAYYEWSLDHLRPGGVVAVHNALWGGSVAQEVSGTAIDEVRSFNALVAKDRRVVSTIYPAGDGTLVAVKLG